ncbi:MAG: RdgB/HAM1 family non-canonical purine NTP pyrophosphatase [Candidatus Omnitrophota bacterium]
MTELLVATKNEKKLREIKELLADLPFRITSLKDCKNLPEIVEDGKTFAQNAIIKAATIAQATGKLVLGEDSGLEVRVLGKRPGVYSARYAAKGPHANASDEANNAKLLRELRGVPFKKRVAHYRCSVVLADRKHLIGVVSGSCRGLIGFRSKGTHGFGYDPLFVIEKYAKTFGQLGPEIKHTLSHRYKALLKARRLLKKYLG